MILRKAAQMKALKNHKLLLCLFLLFFSSIVLADPPAAGMLDAVDAGFSKLQKPWFDVIRGFAFSLFWKLAILDFAWTAITWVRDRKEFGEITASFSSKIFSFLFFLTLLKMADSWIPFIIESFMHIGQTAANTSNITPDGVLLFGLKVALTLFQQLLELKMHEIMFMVMPMTLVAIIVVLGYVTVAGQLLITLIESYICIGGGVIMLGFGGSKWTADMASSYIKYAVGVGIKLMILYLVIGAGMTLFSETNILASSNTGNPFELIKAGLVILAEAFIFAVLCWQIPSMASAMATGSPSMSLGSVASTATALLGAQMATNLAKQSLGAGQSLGGNGINAAKNTLGSVLGGRANSLEQMSANKSSMPASAIPDPNGPPPPSGDGNASNASIGSNTVSAETQGKLDKIFPKDKTESQFGRVKPISDSANIQVSGINLSHGKE